jgi:hypothetical protein
MSDSTPTPERTIEPGWEDPPADTSDPAKKKGKRGIVLGCLIALAIVAIVILALWLLRSCAPAGTSSTGGTASQSPVSVEGSSTTTIEDRVHAALHAQSLTNGSPLDTLVYIFTVSTTDGVSVLITLTPMPSTPKTGPQSIATACQNAVLSAVPEVTRVEVIDSGRVPISSQTRK